jgi:hypothetical protein
MLKKKKMRGSQNEDPGKNNSFIQMIRQAEEIWNEYKGLNYMNPKECKRQLVKLKKMFAKLKEIDWEKEFEFLELLHTK